MPLTIAVGGRTIDGIPGKSSPSWWGVSAAAGGHGVRLALTYVNDRGVGAGAVNVGEFGSSSVNGQVACDSDATKPAVLLDDAPHAAPCL